jgi:hypothetical protein
MRREQFNVVAPDPRGMAAATALSDALEMERPPSSVFTPGGPGGVPRGRLGLNVLQVAVSDADSRTKHAVITFYMVTVAKPSQPRVGMEHIEFDPRGRDVPRGERVTLRCHASGSINMSGWQLRDLARHTFTFPTFTLHPAASVTI